MADLSDRIRGYHYTNDEGFSNMRTGWMYREKGLTPIRRFAHLGIGGGLPSEAHDGVIEALLEPEPASWKNNVEFPTLWSYLMGDVCRRKNTLLLSFELTPQDKAFVVDRAHIERQLYRLAKGQGEPTKEDRDKAYRAYWESRVPVFDYKGGYSVPQLTIWSPIAFERLHVEWQHETMDKLRQIHEETDKWLTHLEEIGVLPYRDAQGNPVDETQVNRANMRQKSRGMII
jgi:hypothetical protein